MRARTPSAAGRSGPAPVDQPLDAPHGNSNPVGAVVELVVELVHRFLKLQKRQELFSSHPHAGKNPRGAKARAVAPEEGLPRLRLPSGRLRLEPGPLARLRRAALEERGVRGVAEGPQHPRDIAEWAVLCAPLFQGTSGLSLKVEEDPTLPRAKGLTEVVISMVACLFPKVFQALEAAKGLLDLRAKLEEAREAAFEEARHPIEAIAERSGPCRHIGRLDALGTEGGVVSVGSERFMELACCASKAFQKDPIGIELFARRLVIKGTNVAQSIVPAIGDAGDKLLKQKERRRQAAGRILQRKMEPRSVMEPLD